MSLRYVDGVQPTTRWEVASMSTTTPTPSSAAIADIFLGRAGGTVARLYGPTIGEVRAVRRARISLEHSAPRKRIDIVGYLRVEAEGAASESGDGSSAVSPASTIPAPNCTVTCCGRPTRCCAGR